jgi:predicted RNA-binding Zn-ribbon protein involved in translation (DUF1610 family)
MMSGKQRRKEIMAKRHERMQEQVAINIYELPAPPGAVLTDREALRHNNTYGLLPLFYTDYGFNCRDCGAEQIWTAKQQKWWYEIAQGNIGSIAVRCRPCRKKEQKRKEQARRIHLDALEKRNEK